MSKYVVSRRADHDLERIWRYIAKGSPRNATRYLGKLGKEFEKLGRDIDAILPLE